MNADMAKLDPTERSMPPAATTMNKRQDDKAAVGRVGREIAQVVGVK